MMCRNDQALSYESMLTDPLIRLVMESDGVTAAEHRAILADARDAVLAREKPSATRIHWIAEP